MKKNPRQLGISVLGASGSKCNLVLGRHRTTQDFQAILLPVLTDPAPKTLSGLVKEVFPDATKKQKPSQPEPGEEIDPTA
jgi:hypothetical protein